MTTKKHLPIQPKTAPRNDNAESTPIRQRFPYLHSMPVRLMYDTSETFGEKASKGKKRTTTDHKEHLPNHPKSSPRNANAESTPIRQRFPYLHSMPIRLMYDTSETFGEKATKGKKRTTIDHKDTLTNQPKSSSRNANGASTPLQRHFPHLHSMPVRLMYDTSETFG